MSVRELVAIGDRALTMPAADMIIDNDPPITRHISIPRDMSQLSCSAITAGMVEAVLDGLGFVRRRMKTSCALLTSCSRHALRRTRFPLTISLCVQRY